PRAPARARAADHRRRPRGRPEHLRGDGGGGRRGRLRGDAGTLPRRRALVRRLQPDHGRGGPGAARCGRASGRTPPGGRHMDVTTREIELVLHPGIRLGATLAIPDPPQGIVLFAHGSGSSRFSRRNRYVAEVLQDVGLATLLMDLLTPGEEEAERFTRHLRFDIDFLADRVAAAMQWLSHQGETGDLALGLFGASTGAAAALVAAARD